MRPTCVLSLVALSSLLVVAGCKKAGGEAAQPDSGAAASGATATTGGDPGDAYTITSASNPGGGGSYKGKVVIAPASGYSNLSWTIPGSPSYSGVAIASGDKLGVGWGMGSDYGVAVYKIAGGKLTGTWTAKGLAGVGDEDLEGPATLDGAFKIVKARAPDDKSYTGTVTIKPTGKTYSVTWATSGGSYTGVAIKDGDLLVAGWGTQGKGAGVVLYTKKGSGLDGVWAIPGGVALGTETLSK